MRWMYPAERYMKILKGYVKSKVDQRVVLPNDTLLKKRLSFVSNICLMFNQLDSLNLILLKKKKKVRS